MNKLKNVWLLLALLVGFAACSDDDDNSIVTSTQELSISVDGGTATFTVQTLGDWTIETDEQTWYSVSPLSGSGAAEVTVTVEASTEVASRSAILTISTSSSTTTVIITQIGTSNPEDPSDQDILIRATGGDKEIVLPSNDGYTVSIPSAASSWLSLKESKTNSVVLTAEEYDRADENRTAEVTVYNTDGSFLASLSITQSWRNVEPGELLFQEIFLTSNLIAETGAVDSRSMEQYFILTNNTAEELEIGGVAFCESEINTWSSSQSNLAWEPDSRESLVAIQSMYVIPKNEGKHTLGAYESVLVVSNAQDYSADNSNSFDLSVGDYEWYTESSSSSYMDTDNPDVPNLDVWISNTTTIYTLNSQMNRGYVIAYLPTYLTAENYVDSKDYTWSGTRTWTVSSTGINYGPYSFSYQVLPNDWILDAVNVSVFDYGLAIRPFSSSLDAGYTYCAESTSDTSRYGKSMIRKTGSDGLLVDTNNSTNDFNHAVTASLAE